MSFALVRFRSSPINATMGGPSTTVGYHVTQRFALEGVVTTAFGSKIFDREHTKYLFVGGGPKIIFGNGKWRPFVHVDLGMVHMLPQTAGNSRNSYAIEAGGGADYRFNPRFSGRLEGDWVRTGFFGQSQNNFQLMGGIVFHF